MPRDDRLEVEMGVTLKRLTQELARAESRMVRTANKMEREFDRGSRRGAESFRKIDQAANRSARIVSRLAVAAAGAFSTRELVRFADAVTSLENKLRAASQVSGLTARSVSELTDIASSTRSSLTETGDLYARLLRTAAQLGATEAEVAQATEVTAKAFKAGGAAASEQAAGILQLGQALGSGFLQGDELRSLRENAPLVAQAIANEFETTVGGLKALGAEGELTSDRVFRALLKAEGDIDKAFNSTIPTVADGFTALQNGILEVVAAFNQGSGAGSAFAADLGDIGRFLSDSTETAERFGARVSEVVSILSEVAGGITSTFDDIGFRFSDVSDAYVTAVRAIIDTMQSLISNTVGVGAAIAAGMLNGVDAVSTGAVSIVNAAISVIDSILQKITDGINAVVNSINGAINKANSFGVSIPTLDPVLREGLSPVAAPRQRGADPGLAFREARDRQQAILDGIQEGARRSAEGLRRRVTRAGESPFEEGDPRGNQISPPNQTARPARVTPVTSQGGRGVEKSPTERRALVDLIEREKRSIQDRIDLLGLDARETAKVEAQQRLLAEAKRLSLDLDKRQEGASRTLREVIEDQSGAIADLAIKYENAKDRLSTLREGVDQISEAFGDAIVAGDSLGDAFKGVLRQMLSDLVTSGLKEGIGSLFNVRGGSGGGFLGSLFSGFFNDGGRIPSGKFGIAGENGPEFIKGPASVTSTADTAAILGRRGGTADIRVTIDDDGGLRGYVERTSGEVAVQVSQAGIQQNNREINKRQGRPRLRG